MRRIDYKLIEDLVPHGSTVLDLACGDGELLNQLIREMVRVGRQAIVSFPNFAHWTPRLQLFLGGRMPVSRDLPYQWWDTPNIHLCTIKDFRALCLEEGLCSGHELYG